MSDGPVGPDARSAILSCARDLFSLRGYDAVGVLEIVRSAGFSKPTLYHYFESKRGLLEVLIRDNGAPLLDAVVSASEYRHDLPKTLDKLALAIFDFARLDPAFYRMILAMSVAPPGSEARGAVEPFVQAILERISTMFEAAARDHGNMKGRHRAYALTFFGMINTYVLLSIDDREALRPDMVRRAVHQFMHGIFS